MFEMSEQTAAEFRAKLRAEAEERLSETVEAAAGFRRGGASARMGISKARLGALAYAASALSSKRQAGGLPDQVLLAVTPERLHAFKLKIRGRKWSAGEEVGSWERAGLRATTDRRMNVTMLTIESPGDDFKATLAPIGVQDDPVGQELIEALGAR